MRNSVIYYFIVGLYNALNLKEVLHHSQVLVNKVTNMIS